MRLTVVIVNYNVMHYLDQCLRSVMRASQGLDVECVVVDNASSDGSVAYLRPLYPSVRFIENSENSGFSCANNIAVAQASGDIILLLNPDTFVSENLFRDVLSFMAIHPDAGGVGVRMLGSNGAFALESRRGVPTPFTSFCKMAGLGKLFPKSHLFGRYYMQYLDPDQVSPIEIMSGACMFVRMSYLTDEEFLDESFFMYGEDIDLSYRLLLAGGTNYYLPLHILHYKGESTKKHSLRYVNAFYQAMLIFFRKHFSKYGVLLSLPVYLAIYAKACYTYIVQQIKYVSHIGRSTEYYVRRKHLLLVGSHDNMNGMKELCQSHSVSFLSVETERPDVIPDGLDEEIRKGVDYVVFDTDTFSYNKILEVMEHLHDAGISVSVGTWQPGKIITDAIVLC